jgi:hypothetical protein
MMVPDPYRRTDAEMTIDSCPNCGKESKLQRRDMRVVWPWPTANRVPQSNPYTIEEIWTCLLCDKSAVRLLVYGDGDILERDPEYARFMFPVMAPRTMPPEAPLAVQSLFTEASVAENAGALRGAAVLYRAAVERLADDQGATGRNLKERINALKGRQIEDEIVSDLHEARLLGNWSIHEGVEFSPGEVADVAQLILDAVHELYVQPAQRDAMREARAARRDTAGTAEGS